MVFYNQETIANIYGNDMNYTQPIVLSIISQNTLLSVITAIRRHYKTSNIHWQPIGITHRQYTGPQPKLSVALTNAPQLELFPTSSNHENISQ